MRVMRIHDKKDIRRHEEEVPVPAAGEVLIKLNRVGVCASDVHWYQDGRIGSSVITAPVVLGHEAAGTICKLGPGVDTRSIGDRVAIEPSRPCLTCEYCREGFHNVCPNHHFMGHAPVDGAFREYMAWPAYLTAPVPDTFSFEEAAMVEPFGVGLHAVNISHAQPGHSAAVLGGGAIGLSVLQCLLLKGIRNILLVEPIKPRRELAEALGANIACKPARAEEAASTLTSGRGFDVVYECAGESSTVADAVSLARIMGQVIVVGIPYDDCYALPAANARRKQLRAVFSRRSNVPIEEVVATAARTEIDLKAYATHIFDLEELPKALAAAGSRENKLVRAVVKLGA